MYQHKVHRSIIKGLLINILFMQSKTTAKDFFLYLGVMIGLYVSTVSFLILVFTIIDKALPLVNEYVGGFDGTIRSSLAALIIFFPAFIYISLIANKDLSINPDKKDMWVRRWMIFLTLFIAGLTIAIDLTTLIYRFLGAEDLSARFFLKVFFILAVAVTIFRFTLNDLKRTSFEVTKQMKIFILAVFLVILSSVIYGMIMIGSPALQRARSLDEQRVNDLSNIQTQIVYTQWQNKGSVPTSTKDLNDPISGFVLPQDPETNQSYSYKMLSKNSFEICADFKTVNKTDLNNQAQPRYVGGMMNENWQHDATTTCFTRVIDPTLYKVTPTPKSL